MITFDSYKSAIKKLSFGKKVGQHHYVLIEDIKKESQQLKELIDRIYPANEDIYNLVKLFKNEFKISLLSYPTFWDELHPALDISLSIDLNTGKTRMINYRNKENKPILHRKETFILSDRPEYKIYSEFTEKEESLGLYKEKTIIGFSHGWQRVLKKNDVEIKNHEIISLVPTESEKELVKPVINRHKTAISRANFSKPIQHLLKHKLLTEKDSLFDYGCGLGDDIRALSANGFTAFGWDPVHNPKGNKKKANIVNLGFVLNVIEDPSERIVTLEKAYSYAKDLLIISTLTTNTVTAEVIRPFGDGVLTSRNTFQKFFEPAEIHHLIEETLHTSIAILEPGFYIAFKKEQKYQEFLANQSKRRINWDKLSLLFYPSKDERDGLKREEIYQKNKELIESFWERMIELGRLPKEEEFSNWVRITDSVGNPKKLQDWFIERYGKKVLIKAYENRKEDLLVYLALSNFKRKVSFSHLPKSLQYDIKGFFGSYSAGEQDAMKLLFQIGDPGKIETLCNDFDGGIRLDHQALYLEKEDLSNLPSLLRMYVGTAGLLYGDIDEVDVIKIHKRSGKVTFLIYENYEDFGEENLHFRIKVDLPNQKVWFFDHHSKSA